MIILHVKLESTRINFVFNNYYQRKFYIMQRKEEPFSEHEVQNFEDAVSE
jgi:hypothetical protein